jgi:hypothetical protein
MASKSAPKLECDLVIRGGITSGIVYPGAIAKLAETYNFRSIGGTSAGAIAAAATAAAAYGAKHGKDRFQTDILELPEQLGKELKGKTHLEFCRPQSGRPVILTWKNHRWIRYRSLMAGLELTIKRTREAWNSDYWHLINRAVGKAPGYQFRNKAQREFARKATKQVLVAAGKWTGATTFDRYDGRKAGRSPRPKPVLRMMPRGSNDPRVERAG